MKPAIISLLIAALLLTGAATYPIPTLEDPVIDTLATEAPTPTEPATPQEPVYEIPQEAVRAALAHAGLSSDQIRHLEMEYDADYGIKSVEITFDSGDYEYDYVIRCETWEILANNKEYDPEKVAEDFQPHLITPQDAVDAVLAHAGLTADQARNLETEYDDERGETFLEISFEANGYEYEYEVQVSTGAIIQKEVDRDN